MLLEVVTSILLAGSPQAAATPPAERPVEKKICRKEIETGSLIKGRKICHTAREWQKISDASRDDVERTVSMGSRSGQ
ncbi:hypothetical protein [Sphingomonas sp.]|uniref:hypothetical protein n=1 Tax=Sphingomonas sp. TaxID=28214 RepID=UPI002DBE3F33|nr:hypothetical protein [Sphingomonas sp.]HEU4969419.1 hypothetical protein [Sphingomonas sp.]